MKWRYSQHLYHSLGKLWLIKGDADKALMFAGECLKLAEPTLTRKNLVKGWRLKGQAFCAQGSLHEAEQALQKALGIATEIGNPPQLWKTYQALGKLYERKGEAEQAQSAYTSAMQVIEDVASRLQDQELKHTFLSAQPVQAIRTSLEQVQ
jgi:tetratricopeptide (TPR) repeat protein